MTTQAMVAIPLPDARLGVDVKLGEIEAEPVPGVVQPRVQGANRHLLGAQSIPQVDERDYNDTDRPGGDVHPPHLAALRAAPKLNGNPAEAE